MAEPHILDRPVARVGALVCFAAAAGVIVYVHRDDLFAEPPAPQSAAEKALADCMGPRIADIERMQKEGVIQPAQAQLFRSRAEALCIAQTQGPGGLPPMPVLPPRQ